MSTETQPIVVTEFLRPENSHEGVVYEVSPFVAEKLEKINEKGLTACCDIYPDGNCRVYIYDPVGECLVSISERVSHSVASQRLETLITYFDLSSYP